MNQWFILDLYLKEEKIEISLWEGEAEENPRFKPMLDRFSSMEK